jgi:hypothetical protein
MARAWLHESSHRELAWGMMKQAALEAKAAKRNGEGHEVPRRRGHGYENTHPCVAALPRHNGPQTEASRM